METTSGIRPDRLRRLPDRYPSDQPGLRLGGQVATFAAIGILSTAAYVALYAGLRGLTAAPIANALALVVTAVANTSANRRFTFGVRGREAFARDQAAGLAAFGIALVVTTASISILALLAPAAPRVVELGVLVVANGIATVTRFVLLRAWIARDRRPALSAATSERNPS